VDCEEALEGGADEVTLAVVVGVAVVEAEVEAEEGAEGAEGDAGEGAAAAAAGCEAVEEEAAAEALVVVPATAAYKEVKNEDKPLVVEVTVVASDEKEVNAAEADADAEAEAGLGGTNGLMAVGCSSEPKKE
jgi:hypothetical protein